MYGVESCEIKIGLQVTIFFQPRTFVKMHPIVQHAHACLLKGPLGVAGLCALVVEYAKCWVANVSHGSSFLIVGKRNAGKKTLLRDVLQRRSYHYRHGEIVTRLKMSPVGCIKVKQEMGCIKTTKLRG